MHKPKQTWDTRAWLIGIVGGTLSAAGLAASFSPHFAPKIESLFLGADSLAGWLTAFLSLVLLPTLLSGIAKRRYFLWGLVPLLLFLPAGEFQQAIIGGWSAVRTHFWMSLLALSGFWIAFPGPTSLFRWLRCRAKQQQEAQLRLIIAQQEEAAVPREGVWPPPPEYKG